MEMNCIFFIQAQSGKDKFAFFTETEATYTQGQAIILKLRQRTDLGGSFSNCVGASIYINGVKQDGILTDSEGNVTLPKIRSWPELLITAEKLINTSDWDGGNGQFRLHIQPLQLFLPVSSLEIISVKYICVWEKGRDNEKRSKPPH